MRDAPPVLRRLLLATAAAAAAPAAVGHAQLNPSPPTLAGTADTIRVLLDQAAYLRGKNQTKRADEALSRVLSLDPRNADALALKAQIAAEAGDNSVAQAMLGRLVLMRPDDPRIEAIRQAVQMGPLDKAALADARRAAGEGRAEDAVAAYRRVFHGDVPPAGLAVEYFKALGATQASWLAARDGLSAQLRGNPQDLKAQLAFAQLLTYRDATRDLGLERLRKLALNHSIADQATLELHQAEAASPVSRATTTAEPRPHTSMDEATGAVGALASSLAGLGALPTAVAALATAQDATVPAAPQATPVATARAAAAAPPPEEPVTRDYERFAQYVPQADLPPPASLLRPASPLAGDAAPGSLATPPPAAVVDPANNPFRTVSAPTPDEPAATPSLLDRTSGSPLQRAPEDPLTADIDRSIQQVSNDVAPRLEGSLSLRGRSGPTGQGQLFDVEAPIEASYSPNGYGRLKVVVTPVGLFSGTVTGTQKTVFGSNPLVSNGVFPSGGTQSAGGAAIDVGYAYGPFSGDVGSTPIGFLETNVVGGLQYAPHLSANLTLRLTAERRAVTDSLLSYGGQRDPRTGVSFGGVTRNRLYAQLEDQIGPYSVYAGFGGAGLYGQRVQSNSEIEAGAGVSFPVYTTRTQEVRVGTSLIYFTFNRNLDNYTIGQGGYFSPQTFLAALFPVTYRQQVTPDLTYTVGGTIGVQSFRTKAEAVFPSDSGLQSQLVALNAAGLGTVGSVYGGSHVLGPAGGARAEVDYRVNDRLHIGGRVGFDRSGNFTEGTGLVYARYVFADPN